MSDSRWCYVSSGDERTVQMNMSLEFARLVADAVEEYAGEYASAVDRAYLMELAKDISNVEKCFDD